MTDSQEKQVYKKSLIEVVNYLNNQENGNKQKVEISDEKEENEYSKKKIRRMNNRQIKSKAKKEKHEMSEQSQDGKSFLLIKNQNQLEKKVVQSNNEGTENKLTRKERRKLKVTNKGEGMSSKDYMKILKESNGRKLEVYTKDFRRDHMPSKTKNTYKQRSNPIQNKKKKRNHKR